MRFRLSMNELAIGQRHLVRCIKPNVQQSAGAFTFAHVSHQLRCFGGWEISVGSDVTLGRMRAQAGSLESKPSQSELSTFEALARETRVVGVRYQAVLSYY